MKNKILIFTLLLLPMGIYAMHNDVSEYGQSSTDESPAKKRKTGEQTYVDAALDSLNNQIKDTEEDFSKLILMRKMVAMQARVQAEILRRQVNQQVQGWQEKIQQELLRRQTAEHIKNLQEKIQRELLYRLVQAPVGQSEPVVFQNPIIENASNILSQSVAYASSMPWAQAQPHSIFISPDPVIADHIVDVEEPSIDEQEQSEEHVVGSNQLAFPCNIPGCKSVFNSYNGRVSHWHMTHKMKYLYMCPFIGCIFGHKNINNVRTFRNCMRVHENNKDIMPHEFASKNITGDCPLVSPDQLVAAQAYNITVTKASPIVPKGRTKKNKTLKAACGIEGCHNIMTGIKSISQRQVHWKVTHKINHPYMCLEPNCNNVFAKKMSLMMHVDDHRVSGIPCAWFNDTHNGPYLTQTALQQAKAYNVASKKNVQQAEPQSAAAASYSSSSAVDAALPQVSQAHVQAASIAASSYVAVDYDPNDDEIYE